MNSEKWCDCCEISIAEYNYEDGSYCHECLLHIIDCDGKIETSTTRYYYADGEYMGNDDEYGEDEIVKSIADYLGIEKIK